MVLSFFLKMLLVLSAVILLQFPQLCFLHFPDRIIQEPAVVVRYDLSQRAAAWTGSNAAEWTEDASSDDDQVYQIYI